MSEVGAARRMAPGEVVCGDSYSILAHGRVTTIALADGLGHGPDAAHASACFCDYVRAHVAETLHEILLGSHRALASTRGAAAALLRHDEAAGTLEFVGVGNIDVKARSKRVIAPVCTAGVLGARMRSVTPFHYQVDAGDLVVLYSDGIRNPFDLDPFVRLPAQAVAEKIVGAFRRDNDDAACVVLRI